VSTVVVRLDVKGGCEGATVWISQNLKESEVTDRILSM
jgi:hypothetical protein